MVKLVGGRPRLGQPVNPDRPLAKQLRGRISGKCRLLHGRCLILSVKKQSLGFGFSKAGT
ncbi:MAG: hypothetical protein DME22_26570 [Verrucomicrobia bacterium]|nr:MAG: hypothetical protein DME22_26570 [Verrucomicrobiota bacterium]